MISFRARLRAIIAAPALLALAACGGGDEAGGDAPRSEPIAAIPAPEGSSWADVAAETPEGGFVMGNPDAPVKLVEYASHSCGHCATFSEQASGPLRDKYIASGVVSYELRNQIHDPIDLTYALLARCSGPDAFHSLAEQGWMNLEAFFNNVQGNQAQYEAAVGGPEAGRFQGVAQVAGMMDFVAARGISQDQAMACLADTEKAKAIMERSNTQSEELNVTGTPTFFLNGKNLGTTNWAGLEPMLQNAGAR